MNKINFPVKLTFKLSSIANDFTATDASNATIAYVRQKMFKFKEDIQVFADDSKTTQLYSIKADKWLDFSTAYTFYDNSNYQMGKVARKGWRSIWKASYDIIDKLEVNKYKIREENPWAKVADGFLGDIPALGMLTGYLFNPSYIVTDLQGQVILRLKKIPGFLGWNSELTKVSDFDENDSELLMLGLMMMILLEKRRG